MDFDKKTIITFVLIVLILIISNSGFYQKQQQSQFDTAPKEEAQILSELEEAPPVPEQEKAQEQIDVPDEPKSEGILASVEGAAEKFITIETDLYRATFTTRGASLVQWELLKYDGPDDQPVNLFHKDEFGTLGIGFTTQTGDSLGTANIIFETDADEVISLAGDESFTLEFSLPVGEYRSIKKSYTFYNGKYDIDMNVNLVNMSDIIADKRIYIAAPNGLASTEKRLKDDMMYAKAATYAGGDIQKGYKANGKVYTETGNIDWVAVRTKYFALYIIPEETNITYAEIVGEEITVQPDAKEKWKKYNVEVAVPYLGERNSNIPFSVYLGPLEYDILKKYEHNLHEFMDFGWGFIKWFSLPILKTLKWMHNFIPNYGVVLLIFALLIKIIVYPLTHKSYESMQKMQKIQPKLKELQEKYKGDPQKLNQATMAMYKQEGVNPMGGCLPMLIQMPLLFGLFIVFRTTIELRGEGFFWWITDLSAPDTIYTFPGNFSLPLYGDSVNILPLVMGATMFIQQKMTVTDPKQKLMVYFMPIFLTLLFNSFPSGLNLYYALFNLLSILQQKYLTPKKAEAVQEAKVVKKRKK